jgi:hypothetical protein
MKRKVYQNPTMKVVELTRRTCLLETSEKTSMENYNRNSKQDW